MESKPGVDKFSIILEVLRHPDTPVPSDNDAPVPIDDDDECSPSETIKVNPFYKPMPKRKKIEVPTTSEKEAVSEKRSTLSRKSTAKPLSRKSGKKEAKPRKKRGRKPVDQSF